MTRPLAAACLWAAFAPVAQADAALDPGRTVADGSVEDGAGTLNPPELSLGAVMGKVRRGEVDMTTCAAGYYITKSGRHSLARELFALCAEAGWTGAMTWMGQLEDNGLGGPEDAEAAARWDRRAAEAGDPVGQFNLGLDHLRGRGVARDAAAGRALIDRAAEAGFAPARRLRAAGYDPSEVTPDADEEKYAPRF